MPPSANLESIISYLLLKGKRKGGKTTAYKKQGKNPNLGRPTVNPKNNRLEIRLSDSEYHLLDECVKRTGRNKTDVIVKGIAMSYNELLKNK